MKTPNLFIVGHPRSGTSSLHAYLSQHPDIFMTAIKEPNHFAADFRKDSDRFHGKELYFPYREESRYLQLYRSWKDEKIGGEASATNLCSRVAAAAIHAFNPRAKIIMMFREPVDFLYSYHSAARFALGEHHADFKAALEAEDQRRKGRDLSRRVITPSWLFYSDFVKYADQLARFEAQFDRDRIMVILFDDFKQDTAGVYREVLEFLEVDSDFSPEFTIVNPNKRVRWPLLKKYTLDSPYFRRALRRLFSDDTYADLKNFYKNRLVAYQPRPKLDPGFRAELRVSFRPEVEKFSRRLKKDLIARWGYDKNTFS